MNEILQGILTWQNALSLAAIILTWALTTIFIGNSFLKELKEAITSIRDAIHKDSPGGEKITKEEAEIIVKEILDVLWDRFKNKLGFLKVFAPGK